MLLVCKISEPERYHLPTSASFLYLIYTHKSSKGLCKFIEVSTCKSYLAGESHVLRKQCEDLSCIFCSFKGDVFELPTISFLLPLSKLQILIMLWLVTEIGMAVHSTSQVSLQEVIHHLLMTK